ncbi:MAG TPA: metal-dependent transcriptional regulator [Bryobacteraceae bacterium]|nr:metal-dependent transcriptional regulator [Bryobacteraceae bacterium]
MRITVSKEDYLKAIAEAHAEGEPVIAATLARWLGVSAPAVMMAVRRLGRDGLIRVGRNGHITLSASGAEIADRLQTRHNLIERMLTEMFGMEWYKVHEEAERLEHAVSEEFESRLIEVLGNGKPCPHGNLPGQVSPKERRRIGWRLLDEVEAGGQVVVASVFERDRELLEYFNRLGLLPGAAVAMESRNCDETFAVRVAGRSVQIGRPAAAKVWVRPAIP